MAKNSKSKILSDITIKGDLFEKEDLEISGEIQGNVNAQNLEVRERAKIKGNIKSAKAFLNGNVLGDVDSEKIHLSSSANVKGRLSQKTLSIEEGAKIDIKTKTND